MSESDSSNPAVEQVLDMLLSSTALTNEAICQRDRARATAVHLEQQLAAAASLLPTWERLAAVLAKDSIPVNRFRSLTIGVCVDDLRRALGADL